ncbi:hypothetical protein IAI10_13965 [Clostridium sp. 19966]|uniref:hypothetical protein n=1 Tax=Clostridium sp. 19966 TaxID=2768166 RepID=UPI0028DF9F5C|nr:hypothetical protein [Clostridium sp. 19966]MDT8717770.1 hypothetical protein [Clostridium sp. 19966]
MSKYIKKAIAIEAEEYKFGLEDGFDEIESAIKAGLNTDTYVSPISPNKIPFIVTLEGKHYINDGDYIITGVDGERYPCKKEIFLRTYTLANQ